MAYGTDVSVFVEDKAGDGGAPQSTPAWWLSPDVDIPAHSGVAVQGSNDVRIRVHAHEEPILQDKITAEVYVGNPSLVMSPTTATKRIDPGNLLFRTVDVPGSEPIANENGAEVTFSWTPSASGTDVDGPGHHCLVLRAFPVNVTPEDVPFDVPNEQHEAQHNIEILSTTQGLAPMGEGGAGTPHDPRRRDDKTELWWERFETMAAGRIGRRFIVWAFDPAPAEEVVGGLRRALKQAQVKGFSKERPRKVTLEAVGTDGTEIDPRRLLGKGGFAERSGLGRGLFAEDRLLAAAELALAPEKPAALLMRFDHSNLEPHTAVVLHGAQWNERGDPEGGMTVVALAPRSG